MIVPLILACSGKDDGTADDTASTGPGALDIDRDGYVVGEDCNDDDELVYPGADERCNGADDNCNGDVDEGLYTEFYRDADEDGYGDPDEVATACLAPNGFVSQSGDCDDDDAGVSPAMAEICDLAEVDEDCNGLSNEDDPNLSDIKTWYEDHDGDGFGDPSLTVESCFDPPDGVLLGTDCADDDPNRNPGVIEVCDGADTDEDCDGFADELDPEGPEGQLLHYYDGDGDNDGDEGDAGQYFCDGVPSDYVPRNTDCDDDNDVIAYSIPERCNDGADNDCDGVVDDCDPLPDDVALEADAAAIYSGSLTYDYVGYSTADLGDINGDGYADFGFGGHGASGYYGAAYIMYGPTTGPGGEAEDMANVVLRGSVSGSYLGYDLVSVGDQNGDGYDDIAVTDGYYYGNNIFIIHGPISGDTTAESLAESTWSETQTWSYTNDLAGGRDINGDGYIDVAVGGYAWDSGSYYNDGVVYVVYGSGSGMGSGDYSLPSDYDERYTGTANNAYLGGGVEFLPDVNGDGVDDLGMSGYYLDTKGSAYIVHGGPSMPSGSASVADTTLLGDNAYDYFGTEVAGGDLNGDGYGDFVVTAAYEDRGGSSTGTVYVFPGGASGVSSGGASSQFTAFTRGENANDYLGNTALDVADANQDGIADLLVGAAAHEEVGSGTNSSGAAYFFHGPLTGYVPLEDARAKMVGWETNTQAGGSVSFVGDQDNDTSVEMLIGGYTGNGYVSGERYAGNVMLVRGNTIY